MIFKTVSKILKTIKLQKISKTLKLSARLLFPEVYGMPRSQNFPRVFLLSLPPRGVPWICWGPNCFFTPTSRKRSLVFCLNPDKNFLFRFFSTTNVLLFQTKLFSRRALESFSSSPKLIVLLFSWSLRNLHLNSSSCIIIICFL